MSHYVTNLLKSSPHTMNTSSASSPSSVGKVANPSKALFAADDEAPMSIPAPRKRNIDSFLEELKRDQQRDAKRPSRESAHATTMSSTQSTEDSVAFSLAEEPSSLASHPVLAAAGGAGASDPNSTNVYINNITTEVTEQTILMLCSRSGPVGSIKVMWPRSDEERLRNRSSCFVSFMTRAAAEQCVINLQDSSICGHQVRLSWSKACELPPVALPTLNTPSGWDAKPWEAAGVNPSVYAISASALKVVVQFPANARIQMAIDKMATLVHRRGYMFEQYVIDRESDSADFFFLTELDCAEHVFYRWRLHSLSQGDSLTKWRTTPFQFITGGAFWYPPPMPVIQVEKRDDKNDIRPTILPLLSAEHSQEWQTILSSLTVERGSVRSAMLFALEHADACKLISNALIESLTQSDTALSTKLARLYLLSDILHNAATPAVRGAGAFRSELQHRLKEVFVSFRAASLTIESRLASEAFKDKVLRVLRVWYAWSTFAPSKLDELESLFLNGSADPVVGGDDHIDGVPM